MVWRLVSIGPQGIMMMVMNVARDYFFLLRMSRIIKKTFVLTINELTKHIVRY